MIKAIKNLTRKQIILIVLGIILLVGIITSVIILLNKNSKEEIKICLVEFETNGGTSINSQEIKCGSTINMPSIKPEKIGFEFINWTYNNEEFDFNTKIEESIILNANYEKTTEEEIITVTFNSNGGNEIKPIELIKGTTITEPVKPSRNGYVFDGWYLNDIKFDFNQNIEENITLSAKWTENKTNQGNTGSSTKPNGNTGNQGGSSTNNNQGQTGGNTGNNQGTTETPKPNDKYTYIGMAKVEKTCPSGYKLYNDYCYVTQDRGTTQVCDYTLVNGQCYILRPVGTKYYCDGDDLYLKSNGFCYPKVYEVRNPHYDGTCPEGEDAYYELNAEGKCEGWHAKLNDAYIAHISYSCNEGGVLSSNNKCMEEYEFRSVYEPCPTGWLTSGVVCYDTSTKKSLVNSYKCDTGILIGDKCYIEN